jgi:hypothetical protein
MITGVHGRLAQWLERHVARILTLAGVVSSVGTSAALTSLRSLVRSQYHPLMRRDGFNEAVSFSLPVKRATRTVSVKQRLTLRRKAAGDSGMTLVDPLPTVRGAGGTCTVVFLDGTILEIQIPTNVGGTLISRVISYRVKQRRVTPIPVPIVLTDPLLPVFSHSDCARVARW